MNNIAHFELQVDDIQRSVNFYKNIFGWKIEKTPGIEFEYWHIKTGENGIGGGLMKRPCKTPPQECGTNAYVCTIMVENFDETEKKIMENGGVVAMPKFAITGAAWQGYFLDTEGNTFGIHQPDKNAK